MTRLIDDQGQLPFGIFSAPIDQINYRDYPLTTPMGARVPGVIKNLKFNQFVFFGLTGPDVMAGLAVVDLKYLSSGFLYVYDRRAGTLAEVGKTAVPIFSSTFISENPADVSAGFKAGNVNITIGDNRISARANNTNTAISIDLGFDRSGTSPLRICTKAGYSGWVYTEKTAPIPVDGRITVGTQEIPLSPAAHMGLMDWTAGYMRRQTFWNWAASACILPDGRSLGLNLSCGVNETSFTENAFWIDGKMTKVDTVSFGFNPENLYDPWTISSHDKKIRLTFSGQKHRAENINAGLIATRFTQLMGDLSGTLTTDSGEEIVIQNCPGWAEDHYAKW